MVSLYITAKDYNAESTFFYLVFFKSVKVKPKLRLPFKEDPKAWNGEKKEFTGTPTAKLSTEILLKWKAVALQEIRRGELDGLDVYEIVDNVKKALEEEVKKRADKRSASLIVPFYQKWATGQLPGKEHPNRGNLYHFKTFEEYIKGKKVKFDDVNFNFLSEFEHWLNTEKKYALNTTWSHIKDLFAVLSLASKMGLHSNDKYKEYKKKSEEVDTVYLTREEIKRLHELPLFGLKEKVRDLFLVGYLTAMRFSDYSNLTWEDVHGKKYITIGQQKTKGTVMVPINPVLRKIIEKYHGAPKVSQGAFNESIKLICLQAKINEKIEIKVGKDKTYKEKWQLVSSHTARRSGATNMYLMGIPPIAIRKITGHKTEKSFMSYIRISLQENAEMLAKHPFFRDI